ncbi:MAG: O-antigen ligase family protein [Candidatus Jorgensenbacteria bacterium]|nr:O-antigen ligase family protein [Candidatus Jorgensenbacteria bacterium]
MNFLRGYENNVRALLICLTFAIPFGTKKFLYSFAPVVDEYHAIFLYGTDILLLVSLVLFFFLGQRFYSIPPTIKKVSLAFWIFAVLSVVFALTPWLAAYRVLRLGLYILLALVAGTLIHRDQKFFRWICFSISASAIFQAFIGFSQFLYGKSVGLRLLGESVINATTPNVGRMTLEGEKYLRAIGTMSHANIFAAFLVIGLLCFFYLYLTSKGWGAKHIALRIYSVLGIFAVCIGLIVSFSRSGWITASLVTLLVLVWGFFHKEYRRPTLGLLFVLLTTTYLLLTIFSWAIIPRAGFAPGEGSVNDRITYNKIGAELILKYPWGVGIGDQELTSVQEGLYQARGLTHDWLWQPVHNIYILIASETGIQGILAFLALLGLMLFRYGKNLLRGPEGAIALGMLAVSLLFGLVDHFPWDLPAGQLMLWLSVGLVLGITDNK